MYIYIYIYIHTYTLRSWATVEVGLNCAARLYVRPDTFESTFYPGVERAVEEIKVV